MVDIHSPLEATDPRSGASASLSGVFDDSLLLRAVLDTIADGVLAVDGQGKVLMTNQRFNVLWRIPLELQRCGDDEALLAHVVDQLQDPAAFINEVMRLYGSQEDSLDILHFKDGRIYERASRPLLTYDKGGRLWVFRDVTEQKKLERELSSMAFHDALTGLPNRKMLADRMEQAIVNAHRSGTHIAICYVDLDGFKPINDQYGHDHGDKLLVEISRGFKSAVRAGDTVARAGGDEFIILLNNLGSAEDALPILERILATASQPCRLSDSVTALVTASIGVVVFPLDSQEPDHLIAQADRAMYHAKQSGKNRYTYFKADVDFGG